MFTICVSLTDFRISWEKPRSITMLSWRPWTSLKATMLPGSTSTAGWRRQHKVDNTLNMSTFHWYEVRSCNVKTFILLVCWLVVLQNSQVFCEMLVGYLLPTSVSLLHACQRILQVKSRICWLRVFWTPWPGWCWSMPSTLRASGTSSLRRIKHKMLSFESTR